MGIPIHTVALGTRTATITTPDGTLIPVPPDPEAMRRIAELSGGRAFQVDDADEVDRAASTQPLGLPRGDGGGGTRDNRRLSQRAESCCCWQPAALGTRATARLP